MHLISFNSNSIYNHGASMIRKFFSHHSSLLHAQWDEVTTHLMQECVDQVIVPR